MTRLVLSAVVGSLCGLGLLFAAEEPALATMAAEVLAGVADKAQVAQ